LALHFAASTVQSMQARGDFRRSAGTHRVLLILRLQQAPVTTPQGDQHA